MQLSVIGGGLAGSAAAVTAVEHGSTVDLREKARFPRHKVCGEFLSPEIVPLLEQLGVPFFDAQPACIRRLLMRFGNREKSGPLPETAYGLSRFSFDALLYDRARGLCEPAESATPDRAPVIVAHGRQTAAPRGRRLFGFKAHFRGPTSDAIELHFFDAGYVGISGVENGITNVCGLASEAALSRIGFEYDALLAAVPSLAARTQPLTREMNWLTTGPLVFSNRFDEEPAPLTYHAGDALSFVDPFTGSGMYCALLTGIIAGNSAARGLDPREHLRLCRQALGRPFAFSTLFRNAITSGWAERVAPFVPARLLFRLTRPARRSS